MLKYPHDDPDATGQTCRLNSDCLPQLFCDDGRCTFECREDRDCASNLCISGECRPSPLSPPDAGGQDTGTIGGCRIDQECPGIARICDQGMCTPDCTETGCPEGETCSSMTGRCVAEPPTSEHCEMTGCPDGSECRESDGTCVPVEGCVVDSCGPGERCDEGTGRCQPAEEGRLGEGCARASDCESRLCLDVAVEGQNHTVCAEVCCSEFDCPLGFGCRYTNGVRVCLPSRIYPPGYSFDAASGQPCGPGARACQSGLCNLGTNQCLGVCCTADDCGGLDCQFRQVGQSTQAICDRPFPLGGATGQPCGSEFDCRSGVCVPIPGGVGGQPGQCADLCCRNFDCIAGTFCGQVLGLGGGIVSACVPAEGGENALGEPCPNDERCTSGHCIEGACRSPCCEHGDCPNGERCLPRPNGEGSFVRACVPDGA